MIFIKRLFALVLTAVISLFCACTPQTGNDLTVYMPDGAPALAFAELMHGDTQTDGFSYRVVQPSLIASKVTAKDESKNADFCVLPITAASKLLGEGSSYRMLATVTRGNLYIVTKTGETLNAPTDLIGETVGVIQINEVPGQTLKCVLTASGAPWQVLLEGVSVATDKVNLKPVVGVDGTLKYYLIAEPAVSKQAANGWKIAGDLQAFYGEGGYPQAVLLAKRSILEKHADKVEWLVSKLTAASTWLQNSDSAKIYQAVTAHFEDKGATPAFLENTLTRETVARCGIDIRTDGLRTDVEKYLNGLAQAGVTINLPRAEFYYFG